MLHWLASCRLPMAPRESRRLFESAYDLFYDATERDMTGLYSALAGVMYAILKMDPAMGLDQWLLNTLTTGTGGSLLSVGSAAGVAVMGVDRANYTFMSHLKWAPVIALGYIASIFLWWLVTAGLR